MKYPKINTLWKRDPDKKFQIIEGEYSCPEFEAIKTWSVTEKIDGMNIRVYYNKYPSTKVVFFGRTNKAIIPEPLCEVLLETFSDKKLEEHFDKYKVTEAVLYGEGYGAKIQKGGGSYRKDQGFILFGAQIEGHWCDRNIIQSLAYDLEIESVPNLGISDDLEYIFQIVKSKENSRISLEKRPIEGIVATSEPLMLFKNGNPIMWKLKCKDFKDNR